MDKKGGTIRFPVKCDYCGKLIYKIKSRIHNTHNFCNIGCRDMFHHKKYIPGAKYERLTILEILDEKIGSFKALRCKCECGNETKIALGNWGKTKSCGCLGGKVTHGMTNTSEYKIWRGLCDRCNDETHYAYKDYGGRGIKVGFKNFEEFYKDIGAKPGKGYSIDRIDNNRGYEPGNIRWATMKEQSNNRRSNVKCIINGEEHTLQERADKLGMNRKTLKRYILKGKIKGDLYNYK